MKTILAPALFLLLSTFSSAARDVWIFGGQSNMRVGSQFKGFKEAVEAAVPGVELTALSNQRAGAPLEAWFPDRGDRREKWDELVEKIDALGKDKALIKGMVFYQGESNAKETAPQYQALLTEFIATVRKLTGSPRLPVVLVQLAAARRDDDWGTGYVREAQRRVALADERVAVVASLDLPLKDAKVHIAGDEELGRRQAMAALHLAYGKKTLSGPQFKRAFVREPDARVVALEFIGVKGTLKLRPGWRQGFALARNLAPPDEPAEWKLPDEMPRMNDCLDFPVAAKVAPPNVLLLRFEQPVTSRDRIGWAMSPNATLGPHRRWGPEFDGLTDDSGIPAPAFLLAPVAPTTPEGHLVTLPKLPEPKPLTRRAESFDPSKPFQIGVNGIGVSPHLALLPEEEAGPPPFRQAYWNPANSNETNLFDSKGRVTSIGLTTGSWYPPLTTAAKGKTPDHRLMGAQCTHERSVLHGLDPQARYDLVLYVDVHCKDGPAQQGIVGYRIEGARRDHEPVFLLEPDLGQGHDFTGQYVEATEENGHVGNYLVFHNQQPAPDGTLLIRGLPKKGHPGSARKKGWSALQLIHRAK